jgi:hypothetical protein
VSSHCDEILGTAELPVPNVPGGIPVMVPSGAKRGVVVLFHGLSLVNVGYPYPLNNSTSGDTVLNLSLANDLVADGWVVMFPVELGDGHYSGVQNTGIVADVTNDTGQGSRWMANTMRLWDHCQGYANQQFGNWPMVPFGTSLGGWHALQVAVNRTSTIAAYGAHVAAMLPWTIQFFNEWTASPFSFSGTLNSSMNGLALPQASIQVNESITAALPGPNSIVVNTSGGKQVITYTGTTPGTNTFTGCTGGSGGVTLSTSGSVQQSLFTQGANVAYNALNTLIGSQGVAPPGFIGWETADTVVGYPNQQLLYQTAHAASAPVTSFAGTGTHEFDSAALSAATSWFTSAVDPLCPEVH